jgi:hypothetical protein
VARVVWGNARDMTRADLPQSAGKCVWLLDHLGKVWGKCKLTQGLCEEKKLGKEQWLLEIQSDDLFVGEGLVSAFHPLTDDQIDQLEVQGEYLTLKVELPHRKRVGGKSGSVKR